MNAAQALKSLLSLFALLQPKDGWLFWEERFLSEIQTYTDQIFTGTILVQAVEGLKRGSGHDTYVCAAGYLIGEYGAQVQSATPVEQFKLLQGSFLTSAVDTKVQPCLGPLQNDASC